MENVKLRVVKTADLNQLIDLYKDAGWWSDENDGADPVFIQKIIEGSYCFVIAEYNSLIIGMGRAISDGVSDAYIQDVAVHSKYRGKGLGKLIMDEIISFLKFNGISWIGLISEPKAISFYQRYGFSEMSDYKPFLLKDNK